MRRPRKSPKLNLYSTLQAAFDGETRVEDIAVCRRGRWCVYRNRPDGFVETLGQESMEAARACLEALHPGVTFVEGVKASRL